MTFRRQQSTLTSPCGWEGNGKRARIRCFAIPCLFSRTSHQFHAKCLPVEFHGPAVYSHPLFSTSPWRTSAKSLCIRLAPKLKARHGHRWGFEPDLTFQWQPKPTDSRQTLSGLQRACTVPAVNDSVLGSRKRADRNWRPQGTPTRQGRVKVFTNTSCGHKMNDFCFVNNDVMSRQARLGHFIITFCLRLKALLLCRNLRLSRPKGRPGSSDVPHPPFPFLESQDCHLIPSFYLLSCYHTFNPLAPSVLSCPRLSLFLAHAVSCLHSRNVFKLFIWRSIFW